MANSLDSNLSVPEVAGEIYFLEKAGRTLSDKALRKIDDDSYSWADVVDEFNRCLEYLAGKFNLLELEHTEDIMTDPNVNNVPVPANYMKNLWQCRSLTHNRLIKVHTSVINLGRWYSVIDQSGSVRGVAVKGRAFYYQRIPGSAETLRLTYYRYPDRLYDRDDKPTCLPPHLVEPLLVNYACKEIYSEIEDGEDKQVNTDRYTNKFNNAVVELERFLGPDRHDPIEFGQEIAWDVLV